MTQLTLNIPQDNTSKTIIEGVTVSLLSSECVTVSILSSEGITVSLLRTVQVQLYTYVPYGQLFLRVQFFMIFSY